MGASFWYFRRGTLLALSGDPCEFSGDPPCEFSGDPCEFSGDPIGHLNLVTCEDIFDREMGGPSRGTHWPFSIYENFLIRPTYEKIYSIGRNTRGPQGGPSPLSPHNTWGYIPIPHTSHDISRSPFLLGVIPAFHCQLNAALKMRAGGDGAILERAPGRHRQTGRRRG